MNAALSLSGLEDLASGQDSPRRRDVLSSLTTQFLDLAPRLSDRHIELYDNVFQLLVRGIETDARLLLSQRLASQARAPRATVRNLALDEVAEVAAPVLEHSPALSEPDMVAAARTLGPGHREALARRQRLSTAVTDVLVESMEVPVLVTIAANTGAAFSPHGADGLMQAASVQQDVAQALAERLALPIDTMLRAIDVAKFVVIGRLAHEQGGASASDIVAAVERATPEALGREFLPPPPLSARERLLEAVGMLTRRANRSAAKALSDLTDVPQSMVLEAIAAHGDEPLLIVLRAANAPEEAVEEVFAHRLGLPPRSRAVREVTRVYRRMAVSDAVAMLAFVLRKDRAIA